MQQGRFTSLRVAIIGTGYVGLSTGVLLAYLGHQVTGIDKDSAKLALLRRGRSPIFERGMEELLQTCAAQGRIAFTDQPKAAVAEADIIMIAVGTPAKQNGEADTQYVETAAREVAAALAPGRRYVLVVKSTEPVGSNRRVAHAVDQVLRARGLAGQVHVFVASNPEFLREGMALHDSLYPDRIVVGANDDHAVDILRRLYQPLLEQTFVPPASLPRPAGYTLPPLMVTDPTSAELIKYAANGFLALKISFINEIAGLCEQVGGDVTEVARGIGLDHRIGPGFLAAGLGWGGSCFPKDTAALLAMGQEHGYEMPIIQAARQVNAQQRWRVVEKLQRELKGVRGRVIGILGAAFKPLTDDVRETPVLDVVRMLVERGAHVRVHDPVALENFRGALADLREQEELQREVACTQDPYQVAAGADALVLATDWPEYRQLDLARLARSMRSPVLVDARNFYPPQEARAAGFTYLGVGR